MLKDLLRQTIFGWNIIEGFIHIYMIIMTFHAGNALRSYFCPASLFLRSSSALPPLALRSLSVLSPSLLRIQAMEMGRKKTEYCFYSITSLVPPVV